MGIDYFKSKETMFVSQIKLLAAKKNKSYREISKETGIDQAFFTRLAKGHMKAVTLNNLEILKNYFNCNISELIDFDSSKVELKTVDNQVIYNLEKTNEKTI